MKNLIIITLILVTSFLLLGTKPTNAQVGSMMGLDNDETVVSEDGHGESVETILQEILNQQNVSTVQELDLTKISDDNWESLGDAVMEVQHPGQAHEVMDRMMGGEGSDSLRQIHINIGKSYLGNGNGSYGPGMMGHGSMMGGGMMGFGSMMGYGAYGGHSVRGATMWLLAIAFLTSGIYFFIRSAHKK